MLKALFKASWYAHVVAVLIFTKDTATADQNTPQKSQFNTKIYESESQTKKISAIPKIIRDIQGDIQVFFEGQKGPLTIDGNSPKAGSFQEILNKSKKLNKAVEVEFDSDSRQITNISVSFGEGD